MDLAIVDELLTTTRSVRKRLDFGRAVEPEVIEGCIEIAMQAPTGSNSQSWHFLVVTDAEKRARIAELYRRSFDRYIGDRESARTTRAGDDTGGQMLRVRDSAIYLADHMHEAPVLIIPCIDGRAERGSVMAQAGLYGSILPATWSLMLALRARGLGSAWTTLHLAYEQETAALLDIPSNVTQAALLPVAYTIGSTFKPAKRRPAAERTYWDGWENRNG